MKIIHVSKLYEEVVMNRQVDEVNNMGKSVVSMDDEEAKVNDEKTNFEID